MKLLIPLILTLPLFSQGITYQLSSFSDAGNDHIRRDYVQQNDFICQHDRLWGHRRKRNSSFSTRGLLEQHGGYYVDCNHHGRG